MILVMTKSETRPSLATSPPTTAIVRTENLCPGQFWYSRYLWHARSRVCWRPQCVYVWTLWCLIFPWLNVVNIRYRVASPLLCHVDQLKFVNGAIMYSPWGKFLKHVQTISVSRIRLSIYLSMRSISALLSLKRLVNSKWEYTISLKLWHLSINIV